MSAKEKTQPKVTIVLPVHNAAKYLKEALDSICSQTYKNYQCLIIDDGSTDKSQTIIRAYKRKYRKVKVIIHQKNLGLAYTLNEGLQKAKGVYIVRMDSDDIARSDRLDIQVKFMELNKDVDICGAWIDVFGVDNYIWKTPITHNEIVAKMIFECPVAHPSLIMRRSSLERHNLHYPKEYLYAEDYALWMIASRNLKFANYPEILLRYRTHKEQIGNAQKITQQATSQRIRIEQTRRLVVPSEKENIIHAKLGSWVPLNSLQEAVTMTVWLNKLFYANLKKRIYSAREFSMILAIRLFIELFISKELASLKWVLVILSPFSYATVARIILAKYYPNRFHINL